MTRRTKKLGSTARFGTRYGARLRKDVKNIEKTSKATHRCPRCRTFGVRKVSIGIWKCRKCDYTFTGGAWTPITNNAKKINRTAAQVQEKRFED